MCRKDEFFSVLTATCESTRDTLNGIRGGVELAPLDQSVYDDPRVASHNKLALDDEFMTYLDGLLGEWCEQLEALLADNDPSIKCIEDEGPASEMTWWKHRVANLGNVEEQLKGRDAKLVVGVANVAKCNNLKRWKAVDAELTESWNEAKVTRQGAQLGFENTPEARGGYSLASVQFATIDMQRVQSPAGQVDFVRFRA